jgi:ATP-dependent DNA ligase
LPLPNFTPADLTRLRDAFEHEDYLFELKMDGFRSLAYVGNGQTQLVSRRGNVYRRFTELAAAFHVELDCEVALDDDPI